MHSGRNSVDCVMRALGVLTLLVLSPACAVSDEPAMVGDVAGETTVLVVPNALETTFEVCVDSDTGLVLPRCVNPQVNLRIVACSASFSCNRELLHDPITFERAPTLITGFSCGFPDGDPAQDALLSFHPDLRCYKSGYLDNRSSWRPVGGTPLTLTPGEHVFFSSEATHQGDVYTNSATLLRSLREASGSTGFCELDAWGAVSFADMDGSARRAEHVTRSPAVRWRSIIQWTGTEWDCHLGQPAYTSLERVVLASATHDLPSDLNRQHLPASHALVLVREEPLVGVTGIDLVQPQLAAKLRFNETSSFPLEPDDAPEAMTERQLWVLTPGSPTVPLDMRIEDTCAQIDATSGLVKAIGLRVANSDHVELGVIVVRPLTAALDAWDCDRVTGEACRLWVPSDVAPDKWENVVPCLIPGGP